MFDEVMSLPAKEHWKAASDKTNNLYTIVPTICVPTGNKMIGPPWVYMKKAGNSYTV